MKQETSWVVVETVLGESLKASALEKEEILS